MMISFVLLLGSLFVPLSADLVLDIAHINDHHGYLDSQGAFQLKLQGVKTSVTIGGFPALTAMFKSMPPGTLKIHAGDALTGTPYGFYQGQADAEMMNLICFDSFTLGNHEFDAGDVGTAKFFDFLQNGTCNTTVVSANIMPSVGTPLAPITSKDYIKPWERKTVRGADVAVIAGVTIKSTTQYTSKPLPSTVFLDELTAAQAAIDQARSQGIKYIVLASHQGYSADIEMARQLSGVDVIIGGHSHSLLGNTSGLDLISEGAYPTIVTNADGERVCIAQAWEYAKAFGHLAVSFDTRGAVVSCQGNVTLPIPKNSNPLGPLVGSRLVSKMTLAVNTGFYAPYQGASANVESFFPLGFPLGFGAGLAFAGMSGSSFRFYTVTDRGPNGEGPACVNGSALPGLAASPSALSKSR